MSDQQVPPTEKPEGEQNPDTLLEEAGKKLSQAGTLIADGVGVAMQATGMILADAIRRVTTPAPKKPETSEPSEG